MVWRLVEFIEYKQKSSVTCQTLADEILEKFQDVQVNYV